MKTKKIIISGGGTGGHVFPAIAIANALKEKDPSVEILFVGANGKIEMEKVPEAGYQIKGLPVRGFLRKLSLKNFVVVFNLLKSLFISYKIIKTFKPDIVVGVGGFASGPVVYIASLFGVPALLQEQNSYAGITNKLLAKRAKKICVAYDNMHRYFPESKIIKTGNPVRQTLFNNKFEKELAINYFGLDKGKKTILILGGSGGARSINEAVINKLKELKVSDIQVVWQTGKFYNKTSNEAATKMEMKNCFVKDFIIRMDYAYRAADIVISRAGAATISELCLLGIPAVLVPSPNVAEDHQTKNAMALVEKNAAILIRDKEAKENMIEEALNLIHNADKLKELGQNCSKLGIENSDKIIAEEILNIVSLT
ncbi:MAG: undecaprenyldiphospho-muramoylpentapeptide beta-N-acetylglucosaminyltransferase [Bacteroidota bacterium]